MADIKRLVSSVLFGLGGLLVFAGLNAALGFSAAGFAASLALIGALLYAGAVWFAPRPEPPSTEPLATPVVFDGAGRMVSGAAPGQPLSTHFPETSRVEVARCCAAALSGVAGRVAIDYQGRPMVFEFLPVRSGDGSVVYGLMVSADALGVAT